MLCKIIHLPSLFLNYKFRNIISILITEARKYCWGKITIPFDLEYLLIIEDSKTFYMQNSREKRH